MGSTAQQAGPTVEAAVRLAEHGFYVFPCKPGQKEPATLNGHKAASKDPERVRQLFAGRSDYNIGLVPGRSGHVVVDVDSDEGERELQELWGEIPDTLSWTTGKGRHRLYRTPVPLKSRNGVRPDLDVKAGGGYVVVPPSVHPSGSRYTFEEGTRGIAELEREQAKALAPADRKDDAPPQEELRAPSVERVREVVEQIPNAGEQFASRDAWVTMAYAIKAAVGPDNEEVGLQIFREFSHRWEEGENAPGETEATYRKLSGPYRVGWPYLLEQAGEIHMLAVDAFEADRPAPMDSDPSELDTSEFLSKIRTGAELVAEPRPEMKYVVTDTLARGRVSILAAPPKKGKSTLARSLVAAVAEGEEWCGLTTTRGRVLYLALEEHRDDVADDLELFGADVDNLDVYVGRAPEDLASAVQEAARVRGDYALVIVDTIFRAVRTEDGNAYTDTTVALDDVIDLAHTSGAHIICIHHTRKGVSFGGGDPFEGILGSTGIWASFDAGMMYLPYKWGDDNERVLIVDGRRHVERTTLIIRQDADGQLTCMGSYREARARTLHGHLQEYGPQSIQEIADGLNWGKSTVRKYATYLEDTERARQQGAGVKGDPYVWAAVDAATEFEADTETADLSDLTGEGGGRSDG